MSKIFTKWPLFCFGANIMFTRVECFLQCNIDMRGYFSFLYCICSLVWCSILDYFSFIFQLFSTSWKNFMIFSNDRHINVVGKVSYDFPLQFSLAGDLILLTILSQQTFANDMLPWIFGNGKVILSQNLLGMWLLIYAGSKVNPY